MASSPEPHRRKTRPSMDANEEDDDFSYSMQLVNLSVLPMALQAAFELGIFQILANAGPGAKLSPADLATHIAAANPAAASMLDRILRLLASHSVVGCSIVSDEHGNPHRLYNLTPVSKLFVPDEHGVCLGPVISLLQDQIFLASWSELKNAVREGGIAFNRVHGVHAFEYPGRDPRFNGVFNVAMANQTSMFMKKVVECYHGFAGVKRVVDVGGGLGVTLQIIVSRYPLIKGINFDLPHVIEHAPCYPGVEHVGGDMFESVPEGDAIFMKWILHDWSDEHCLKLLKNCYAALPDDGKLIVAETILPTTPETSAAARAAFQSDVLMMTQNPGGKERSQEEYEALLSKAGFKDVKLVCFVHNMWIMEVFK